VVHSEAKTKDRRRELLGVSQESGLNYDDDDDDQEEKYQERRSAWDDRNEGNEDEEKVQVGELSKKSGNGGTDNSWHEDDDENVADESLSSPPPRAYSPIEFSKQFSLPISRGYTFEKEDEEEKEEEKETETDQKSTTASSIPSNIKNFDPLDQKQEGSASSLPISRGYLFQPSLPISRGYKYVGTPLASSFSELEHGAKVADEVVGNNKGVVGVGEEERDERNWQQQQRQEEEGSDNDVDDDDSTADMRQRSRIDSSSGDDGCPDNITMKDDDVAGREKRGEFDEKHTRGGVGKWVEVRFCRHLLSLINFLSPLVPPRITSITTTVTI
jgi:hypothetical protein